MLQRCKTEEAKNLIIYFLCTFSENVVNGRFLNYFLNKEKTKYVSKSLFLENDVVGQLFIFYFFNKMLLKQCIGVI